MIVKERIIKFTIPSDCRLLRETSEKLVAGLKSAGVAEKAIFDIRICFEEALLNAIVHGNLSRPGKRVNVEAEIDDDEITLTVEDEGEGFDPSTLPDPTKPDNLMKGGGRGVYLMSHLMDRIVYKNGGRRIVMKKFLKKRKEKKAKCR